MILHKSSLINDQFPFFKDDFTRKSAENKSLYFLHWKMFLWFLGSTNYEDLQEFWAPEAGPIGLNGWGLSFLTAHVLLLLTSLVFKSITPLVWCKIQQETYSLELPVFTFSPSPIASVISWLVQALKPPMGIYLEEQAPSAHLLSFISPSEMELYIFSKSFWWCCYIKHIVWLCQNHTLSEILTTAIVLVVTC